MSETIEMQVFQDDNSNTKNHDPSTPFPENQYNDNVLSATLLTGIITVCITIGLIVTFI